MSVYRYKLSSSPLNAEVSTRIIEGVKVHRDAWLVSDERLDLNSFADLIEEQEAGSIAEFDARDSAPPCGEPPKKISGTQRELVGRGFSEAELAGRSEKELLELLAFDASIFGKRG